MDSHDIFKQLTTGVRFFGKRTHSNKFAQKKLPEFDEYVAIKEEKVDENDVAIKTEDEEENDDYLDYTPKANLLSYLSEDSDFDASLQIKDEIKSEDESSDENNEMQLLNSFGQKVVKKIKTKVVSEDKTKKLEDEQVGG